MTTVGLAGVAGAGGWVGRGGVDNPVGPVWSRDELDSRGLGAPLPGAEASLGISRIVWSVPTTEPELALTFDDGPDPEFTPRVLAALERHGIRATFNVMGRNVEAHRDVFAAVVAAGHEIGNHTWEHRDPSLSTPDEIRDDMRRGADIVEKMSGTRPRWFRPPRGQVSGAVLMIAGELDADILMWSLSGEVDDPSTAEKVRRQLVDGAKPGHIVGLHDGIGHHSFDRGSDMARALTQRRNSEIDLLPDVLDALVERGLRFTTVGALVDRSPTTPPPTPPPRH